MNDKTAILLDDIRFDYSADTPGEQAPRLVDGFSLAVHVGGALGIMGSSGSGKSTLAKLMAGLCEPLAGNIRRSHLIQNECDVVYVDQHALNSVFPWQTAEENLAYPLRQLRWSPVDRRCRVDHLLDVFRLKRVRDSYPAQLSGGELQRLALARCLSWNPRVMVLDETFSALDRQTKAVVQDALRSIARDASITFVLITHNIADVLALCSRCIVVGDRPVRLLSDLDLGDPVRRDVTGVEFREAEARLMDLLRNGTI